MDVLQDPFTGLSRIVAPERLKRLSHNRSICPFCGGAEDATPAETCRVASSDGAWRARSFPNLFPLATRHEVLVPTPRHVTTMRELSLDEIEAMLELWFERVHALADGDAYPHLFVNDGPGAGSSVPHVHAQLIVAQRSTYVDGVLGRVSSPDSCAACDVSRPSEAGRKVWSDDNFVLAIPAVPRLSGAMILTPQQHDAHLEASPQLSIAVERAIRALPDHDFNVIMVADVTRRCHWYLEFIPRHGQLAGAELGLNLTVCIEHPDESAAAARARLD